jgi:hypothetical protein
MSVAVGRPIVVLCVGSGLGLGLVGEIFASGLLRQIVHQASSGDPQGAGWRSVYDGVVGFCRVGNSGAASAKAGLPVRRYSNWSD